MGSFAKELQLSKWVHAALFALVAAILALALAPMAQQAFADEKDGTPNAAEVNALEDGAIDLAEASIKFFDGETYQVGQGIYAPNPKVSLTTGVDFGMEVTDPDGITTDVTEYVAAVKPKENSAFILEKEGTYQVRLYPLEGVTTCTGEKLGTITVVGAYFTVYLQDADGAITKVKEFATAKDFEDLAITGAPVSAIYGSNVSSTNNYVKLDDVLDEAGITDKWVQGAVIRYFDDSESYMYSQIKRAQFFPNATASNLDTEDAVSAPFVFALKEYSSKMSGTAAEAQESNLANLNTNNVPRTLFGYINDGGVSSNAGHRLCNNVKSITIVEATEDSIAADQAYVDAYDAFQLIQKAKNAPTDENIAAAQAAVDGLSDAAAAFLTDSALEDLDAVKDTKRSDQEITASNVTKTYGDKAFALGATAQTALTYASNNTKVAAVDANGKVTIKGAGKATITVTAAKTDEFRSATKDVTVTVNKAANPMTVKAKSLKAKKNKKTTFKAAKAFTVKGAQGKVTYKKANKAGKSKIKVASNGKITVAKGLKKGTYKVKVKVTAAGNGNYNKLTKNVTVKIRVK